MGASIKGSQTEKNLLKSFAGESQAKNRYEFFAAQAAEEGYEQIAEMFEVTALQEQAHARRFFDFLEGGVVEITAGYPAGKVGTTAENLKAAAAGENEEWTELYPEFARIAEEEGFKKVAAAYKAIIIAEAAHEERYLKLLKLIETETVFSSEEEEHWECRVCGFTHKGKKPLKKCPACLSDQEQFERQAKNY